MPEYLVDVEWAGYSRGYSQYKVEADNKEDAMENYWSGTEIENETIRDDTDGEATSATLIGDK